MPKKGRLKGNVLLQEYAQASQCNRSLGQYYLFIYANTFIQSSFYFRKKKLLQISIDFKLPYG